MDPEFLELERHEERRSVETLGSSICFSPALLDEAESSEKWAAVSGQTTRLVWELLIEATRDLRNSWDGERRMSGTRDEVFIIQHLKGTPWLMTRYSIKVYRVQC